MAFNLLENLYKNSCTQHQKVCKILLYNSRDSGQFMKDELQYD